MVAACSAAWSVHPSAYWSSGDSKAPGTKAADSYPLGSRMKAEARHSSRTYWRRRAGVVLVVAGVVIMGINGISRIGDSSDDSSNDVSALVASDPEGDEKAAASNDMAANPSTGSTWPENSPETREQCSPSDITVTPQVKGRATAGKPVTLSLVVQSENAQKCTWRVSADSVVVKIESPDLKDALSGTYDDQPGDIWSSQICNDSIPTKAIVLKRGKSVVVRMIWRPFPGTKPKEDLLHCPGTREWMLPGRYRALAAAYGGEPSSLDFRLRPIASQPRGAS